MKALARLREPSAIVEALRAVLALHEADRNPDPDVAPWIASTMFGVARRIVAGSSSHELLHVAALVRSYAKAITERQEASVVAQALDQKCFGLDKAIAAALQPTPAGGAE